MIQAITCRAHSNGDITLSPCAAKDSAIASERLRILWRAYCGSTTSLLFHVDGLGWMEVREREPEFGSSASTGAVLLIHTGTQFLDIVADPLGWWEDAIMIEEVEYSEPDATEEAEWLFDHALAMSCNPV